MSSITVTKAAAFSPYDHKVRKQANYILADSFRKGMPS